MLRNFAVSAALLPIQSLRQPLVTPLLNHLGELQREETGIFGKVEDRVNCVAPGVHATRCVLAASRELRDPLEERADELGNDFFSELAISDDIGKEHALHFLVQDGTLATPAAVFARDRPGSQRLMRELDDDRLDAEFAVPEAMKRVRSAGAAPRALVPHH